MRGSFACGHTFFSIVRVPRKMDDKPYGLHPVVCQKVVLESHLSCKALKNDNGRVAVFRPIPQNPKAGHSAFVKIPNAYRLQSPQQVEQATPSLDHTCSFQSLNDHVAFTITMPLRTVWGSLPRQKPYTQWFQVPQIAPTVKQGLSRTRLSKCLVRIAHAVGDRARLQLIVYLKTLHPVMWNNLVFLGASKPGVGSTGQLVCCCSLCHL